MLLGAQAVSVFGVTEAGDALRWHAWWGHTPEMVDTWRSMPLDEALPTRVAFTTGRPLYLPSWADLVAAFPVAARVPTRAESAVAVLPVVVGVTPVGVWCAEFASPHPFTSRERLLMRGLAAQWSERILRDVRVGIADRITPEPEPVEPFGPADIAFRESHAAMVVHDTAGRHRAANPAACRLLGWSEPQLLGMGYADVTHPDDAMVDAEAWYRLRLGEARVEVGKRLVPRDGGVIPVAASFVAITDDHGSLSVLAQYEPAAGSEAPDPASVVANRAQDDLLQGLFDSVMVLSPVPADAPIDLRIDQTNAEGRDVFGVPLASLVGELLGERYPAVRTSGLLDRYLEVAATGVPLELVDVRYEDRRPDEWPWAGYYDVRARRLADGRVLVVFRDTTARHRDHVALAAAQAGLEAEQHVARRLRAFVDTVAVPIALTDDDGRFLEANPAFIDAMGGPVSDLTAYRIGDLSPRLDPLFRHLAMQRPASVQRVPLPPELTGPRARVEIAGARVAAGGWAFAVIDHTPIAAAARRSAVLADIAGRVAAAVSVREISDVIERALAAELDTLGVDTVLVEGNTGRFLSKAGYPHGTAEKYEQLSLDADVPLTRCMRLRRPIWYESRERLVADFPSDREDVEAAGIGSIAAIPLVASGVVLGALALAWRAARVVDEAERPWCEGLAALLARALDRARQAERDRRLVGILQTALQPDRLHPPEWLEAAAAFRAAGGDGAGGDVYDLVRLPDASVAVFLADICGRGIDAAAQTAVVRHTLRASLLRGDGPSAALAEVDQALEAHAGAVPLVTAMVAVLRPPEAGRTSLALASAGHPPAIIRRAGGRIETMTAPGVLLGLGRTAPRPVVHASLGGGDVLVAYTDGLTDTPRPRLHDDDIARLLGGDGVAVEVQRLPEWLIERTAGRRVPSDDSAVIAVAPAT
jgi:PAS domain S-box-containing protein